MTANNGRPALGDSARAAEQITDGGGSATPMFTQGGDSAPTEAARRRPIGLGNASVAQPNHGREKWRALTRCATDGVLTVHPYDQLEDIAGSVRRGACGHRYVVVVRQVLREFGEAA